MWYFIVFISAVAVAWGIALCGKNIAVGIMRATQGVIDALERRDRKKI